MFSRSRRATFLISALATVGLLSAACSSADAESEGSQGTAAAGYNLTAEQKAAEIASYTARAGAEEAAEQEPDDATAERTRLAADDVAPLKPLDAS